MLIAVNELLDFRVAAQDGKLGEVADVLLSDDSWTVRYIVVGTEDAFEREPILISPMAMGPLDRRGTVVQVHLTVDQVKRAPRLETQESVSRHYEERYYDHYGWPYYWLGVHPWGPFSTPGELARARARLVRDAGGKARPPKHPHLRSAQEIATYRFLGDDHRQLGPLEDIVIDDRNYQVKYLEFRTRRWLPGGRKILVPTECLCGVSWAEKTIKASVPRDIVKKAPEVDPSEPLARLDERPIRSHYGVVSREPVEREKSPGSRAKTRMTPPTTTESPVECASTSIPWARSRPATRQEAMSMSSDAWQEYLEDMAMVQKAIDESPWLFSPIPCASPSEEPQIDEALAAR